ncbi:hypothetical protein [Terrabacter sp. Root181]|uniref:hypothetical protein n=1 Tax=Terrabacter sp. Root181 TaxID=1736484 RepID=UPI00138F7EE5|nr:hypothetical protein [Terrabacter sp. Root181]
MGSRLQEAAARHLGRRWFLIPLAIFTASRLVDTLFIFLSASHQVALSQARDDYYVYEPSPADPGYLGVVSNWDGQWYRQIATDGYQHPSPGASPQEVWDTLWAWAFPPAYPMIVRLVMMITSLSFPVAATIVSCLAGAAAMVLMYRLVARTGGQFLASVTVLFSSFWVAAPLLQVAYSESLALFFLMAALNLLVDRRYGWAAVAVLALSMTRIVTLPLLLAVVVHAWLRYRREGPFWKTRPKDALGIAVVAFCTVFGVVAWMLLASVFIGPQAGMERSSGQRSLYLGWFEDTYHLVGVGGPVFIAVVVLLLTAFMLSPRARVWAPELRAWSVAYPAYLFALTPFLPAVFRYLLLTPTLPVMMAGTPRTMTRHTLLWVAALLVLLLLCQRWYVSTMLVVWTDDSRPGP